jgi:hypothetical protein
MLALVALLVLGLTTTVVADDSYAWSLVRWYHINAEPFAWNHLGGWGGASPDVICAHLHSARTWSAISPLEKRTACEEIIERRLVGLSMNMSIALLMILVLGLRLWVEPCLLIWIHCRKKPRRRRRLKQDDPMRLAVRTPTLSQAL